MFKRKAKEPKIKKPRFQTFRDAYKVTKQVKPWITAALIGIFAVSWGIGIAIGSAIGQPIYYAKDVDIDTAAVQLREVMISMLNQVQENYPDSHVGQRWAPARLGGTAPAPLN